MSNIPIHYLNRETEIGLNVKHLTDSDSWNEIENFPIHRDDNYFFLLAEGGSGTMDVDFNQIAITERELYFVASGQVHHNIRAREMTMWMVLVDPTLIPRDFLEVFESNLLQQKPCQLTEQQFFQFQEILCLLEKQYTSDANTISYKQLIYAILDLFLCAAALAYFPTSDSMTNNASRPIQITREFRKLLLRDIQSDKSPTYYAHQLNISQAYLNETVKKVTGFTVTYWIQQQVMLEAKRLLSFSKLNVKEIAHTLGYDDHTYFSKLFKQSTKITPLAFRNNYLK
jgi:AraC-type DNA-binding domain-containing proteins